MQRTASARTSLRRTDRLVQVSLQLAQIRATLLQLQAVDLRGLGARNRLVRLLVLLEILDQFPEGPHS